MNVRILSLDCPTVLDYETELESIHEAIKLAKSDLLEATISAETMDQVSEYNYTIEIIIDDDQNKAIIVRYKNGIFNAY